MRVVKRKKGVKRVQKSYEQKIGSVTTLNIANAFNAISRGDKAEKIAEAKMNEYVKNGLSANLVDAIRNEVYSGIESKVQKAQKARLALLNLMRLHLLKGSSSDFSHVVQYVKSNVIPEVKEVDLNGLSDDKKRNVVEYINKAMSLY